jgi:hypothetical protein
MAIGQKSDLQSLIADKTMLRKLIEEQNRRLGYLPDPTATSEKSLELMRSEGVRPEDNIGSRGILRMREAE